MVELRTPFSSSECPELGLLVRCEHDIKATVIEANVRVSTGTISLVLSRVWKLCDSGARQVFVSEEASVIRPTLVGRAIPK
jgi:hypothetical protein